MFGRFAIRGLGAGLAMALAIAAAGCGDDPGDDAPAADDSFRQITDCRELEALASAEVDRINTSGDRDIVAAATARFQQIVAHRDAVCS